MLASLKIHPYLRLMRFDKPIGTLLLLWPTWWALWLASEGTPNATIFGIFTSGVIVMRALGCICNDIADRNFDKHVARTNTRPLAIGDLTVKNALQLALMLAFLALGLVIFCRPYTIGLAFIALTLALVYPLMKRVTQLPQFVLGLAFAWSVPMAFAEIQNHIPFAAWLLLVAVMIWTIVYDTMYAQSDVEDDLKLGLKSTAILFGRHTSSILAFLQILFLALIIYLGVFYQLSFIFYVAVAITAGLFVYQHTLLKQHNSAASHQAFLNNNWVGAILFLGFSLGLR